MLMSRHFWSNIVTLNLVVLKPFANFVADVTILPVSPYVDVVTLVCQTSIEACFGLMSRHWMTMFS